jgi:hypothetical protein
MLFTTAPTSLDSPHQEMTMSSPSDLVTLRRSLRDKHVLSVYVDRSASDPAERRAWRTALERRVVLLRNELQASSAPEQAEFERCAELAAGALENLGSPAGAGGWAGFITADGVRDVRTLTVETPTFAMWSTGAWLAPCLRDTKEDRSVIVVVADARRAAIYAYRNGVVERIDALHAHHEVQNPPLHMGTQSRSGFHPGTHGTTGHDSAQRGALAGRDHMITDAVERITRFAGADSWILVGGIKAVRARFLADLSIVAPDRVLELDSLDVHASEAEIAEAARAGASTLRDALDSRRIHEIIEGAGAHGLGAVGNEATKDALDHLCVRQLYLTKRYVGEHAVEAETAVRAAIDQDAGVEELGASAAEFLDRLGGIAAALRFPIRPRPLASHEGSSTTERS